MLDSREDEMPTSKSGILHISDLHFGTGFDLDLWQNLFEVAVDLKPSLVIATGDLVNNPWSWTLRKAKRELVRLRDELGKEDSSCKLIIVPGNHDTRLWGLIPVQWITWSWVTTVFVFLMTLVLTKWTKVHEGLATFLLIILTLV